MKNIDKWYGKTLFIMVFILLFTFINTHSTLKAETIKNDSASTYEEAMNAVINFLKAQKQCDVEGMIENSKYLHNIRNLKEFYTTVCKEWPLKQADITDLTVVNNSLALVSIEMRYKDKLFVNTVPLLKIDEKWKIVRGIPGTGTANLSKLKSNSKVYEEVKQAIIDYSRAVTSGNINHMKKFRKDLYVSDKFDLDQHLKAISEKPSARITPVGIEVISDTLAIAFIETNFEHFGTRDTYAMYKENDQWKIIFGRNLENTAIPISNGDIEIK